MKDDARELVKKIQASMVESAKTTFEEPELDCLRSLIRLTVEFYDYLQHGIPASELKYSIESIFSGIESFSRINAAYGVLVGATNSKIEWGMVSMVSLKEQFASMFHEFTAEANFEKKCRLLLNLFKIQIVFAGVFYD